MAPKYGSGPDDDAPWLAEVEGDRAPATLIPRSRMIGGFVLFALLLILVVTGVYVITQKKQDGASGTPVARAEDAPLIKADVGPYKVAPTDPGGRQIEGAGGTIYTADRDPPAGQLAETPPEQPLDRPGSAPKSILPEDSAGLPAIPPAASSVPPVAKPLVPAIAPVIAVKPQQAPTPVTPKPQIAAAPLPVQPKPVPPKPAETPKPDAKPDAKPVRIGAATLQLGAFASEDKAQAAWTGLTARYGYLAGLPHRTEAVAHGDTTLYRLLVSGDASLCAKLAAAGQSCLVKP